MKKSVKIVSAIALLIIICTISSVCFAGTAVGNVTIPAGTPASTTDLANKAGNIIATLRNVAAIAAAIIVTILGIKYMLGSVEEKAEYKKSFVPLIVGVVVVVLSLQIANMIFTLAK